MDQSVSFKKETPEAIKKPIGNFGQSFAAVEYKTPLLAPKDKKVHSNIAYYGADNALDAHIINLYNSSPTHGAIVRSTAKLIAGKGFTIEGILDSDLKVLFHGISPRKSMGTIAVSKILYGGYGILISYSRTGRIAQMKYVEYGKIRKKVEPVPDEDFPDTKIEKVTGYAVAERWKSSSTKNIVYYPKFDPSRVLTFTYPDGRTESASWESVRPEGVTVTIAEPEQLHVFEYDCPGDSWYATPDWWAADKAIKFEALYAEFHTNNIANGFMPTVFIEAHGVNGDKETADQYDAIFKKAGGPDGKRMLVFFPPAPPLSGQQTLFITPINNHMHDGKFKEILASQVQFILTAHRLSSPVLAGIPAQGNLSPNAGERESAFALYFGNEIMDHRQDILDDLKMVFSAGGRPEWVPKISDKNPYTEENETTTSDAKL